MGKRRPESPAARRHRKTHICLLPYGRGPGTARRRIRSIREHILFLLQRRIGTLSVIPSGPVPCLPDLRPQPVREEALSFQRLLSALHSTAVRGLGRDLEPFLVLLVRHPSPVENPPGPDGLIVHVRKPLTAKTTFRPAAWSIEPVDHIAKVFRAIHRPEGQAPGQKLPASADDGQHPPGPRRVHDVVEPRHRVQQGKPDGARGLCHDSCSRSDVVDRPPGPRIDPPIVHHYPPFTLLLMLWHLLRREGRRAPSRRPALKLSSADLVLKLLVHPLRRFTFQVVRRKLDWRPYGHRVVLHETHGRPRGPFQPKGTRLPSHDLLHDRGIRLGKVWPP